MLKIINNRVEVSEECSLYPCLNYTRTGANSVVVRDKYNKRMTLNALDLGYSSQDELVNDLEAANQACQDITFVTQTIYVEYYKGRSSSGTNVEHVLNATMTRTDVGRWQVRFNKPHQEGESYTIVTQPEEESSFRDTPDVTVVQGSQNANGFDIQIHTGDNGSTADRYVDAPWSWGVEHPIQVLINDD